MLKDKEMFAAVEKTLRQDGRLERFETKYGKVKGRMMITRTEIPEEVDVKYIPGKTPQAFEASFDFYDSTVGLALYTDLRKIATGIWITVQKEGADPPAQDWITFFVEKLIGSMNKDGSYGIPIYSFVNDTCDMTIIPTNPEM